MKSITFSKEEIAGIRSFYSAELEKARYRIAELERMLWKFSDGSPVATTYSDMPVQTIGTLTPIVAPGPKKRGRKPKGTVVIPQPAKELKNQKWAGFILGTIKKEGRLMQSKELLKLALNKRNATASEKGKIR